MCVEAARVLSSNLISQVASDVRSQISFQGVLRDVWHA